VNLNPVPPSRHTDLDGSLSLVSTQTDLASARARDHAVDLGKSIHVSEMHVHLLQQDQAPRSWYRFGGDVSVVLGTWRASSEALAKRVGHQTSSQHLLWSCSTAGLPLVPSGSRPRHIECYWSCLPRVHKKACELSCIRESSWCTVR